MRTASSNGSQRRRASGAKRTRLAGGVSWHAEITARALWPTNRHLPVRKEDLKTVSDELFGAHLYAPFGSDDRAFFGWLSECARELHYGDYWAYHARGAAA